MSRFYGSLHMYNKQLLRVNWELIKSH